MFAMNRQNKLGIKYYFIERADGKTDARAMNKLVVLNASIHQINQGFYDWLVRNVFIQDAMPFLTDGEREFLMTATTPEEWNEMFKDDEDES